MSKIPGPANFDSNKNIFSRNRGHPRKNKPHICPRTTETVALKNRIAHLEKIIEELHSRNDARDIEKLLQQNAIDHQSKLLQIIEHNTVVKDETGQTVEPHQEQSPSKNGETRELLLSIRSNFIKQLLANEEVIQNLLKEKQVIENYMRQMECLLQEKEKEIDTLRAIIFEKDTHLDELEQSGSVDESNANSLDPSFDSSMEEPPPAKAANLMHKAMGLFYRVQWKQFEFVST